jgi:hypothetical protein
MNIIDFTNFKQKNRFFDANHAKYRLSSLNNIAYNCTAPMQSQCKQMQNNAINRVIPSAVRNPTYMLFFKTLADRFFTAF